MWNSVRYEEVLPDSDPREIILIQLESTWDKLANLKLLESRVVFSSRLTLMER